jgi:hypothetical protein
VTAVSVFTFVVMLFTFAITDDVECSVAHQEAIVSCQFRGIATGQPGRQGFLMQIVEAYSHQTSLDSSESGWYRHEKS